MASLEAGRTLPWMRWKVEQNRHLARMRQALPRGCLEAMEIVIDAMESEQNRHLARMAGLEAMEIGIERKCKTDTWLGGGKPQGAGLEAWKLQQMRDLARMSQASRLWKLPLILWKVEQNRHLARMASLEAGRTLPWMRWKVEQNGHLARMRQAARQASRLWKLSLDAMKSGAKQTLG